MRDIELIHIADTGAIPPEPVDNAYVAASAGGILSDTALTDPAMTDTKEYGRPSLGGDFGVGRAAILGADADGGAADLGTDTTVAAPPADFVVRAAYALAGRSANNSSFLNLYPWHKTPPEGLDMNNPNPAPAPAPSPPPPPMTMPTAPAPAHGITVNTANFSGNTGTLSFSGPATAAADLLIEYQLAGGSVTHVHVDIAAGDTASQIAAKVRAALNATSVLAASGSGGSVTFSGSLTPLAGFNISLS